MTPSLLTSDSKEWYTPDHLLERVYRFFPDGCVDLDPCADPRRRVRAREHYVGTEGTDGLAKPWQGTVFCNPPYGRGGQAGRWLQKAIVEGVARGTETVLLLPARTGARWWQPVWRLPTVFVVGRLSFLTPEGPATTATFDSALCYTGERTSEFLNAFGDLGHVVLPQLVSLSLIPVRAEPQKADATL